ncbi:MAG: PKD domain-containing protein [Bacteroidia bacterium]
MKKPDLFFATILLALGGIFMFPVASQAQLSGNYTINPTASASSTNYQNWASAVGDLISASRTDLGTAQGPGVNGAVTITVYDSVYNTQVEITAITGASSTNTITFKSAGGDSTACVLRHASSAFTSDDYVLMLNGADYITFQQIGFERTGTNANSTVIQLTGDADYNKFIRCWMQGRRMPSNSSLGFQYGIGSIFHFTGNADNTEIRQNKMIYGYNGIYGTQSATNNTIKDNVIDTSGSAGIYLTSQSNLRIISNTFNMGDFGPSMGHYTSYGLRIESSPSMLVTKNKVYMMATNGQVVRAMIIANTTSTASAPTMVTNNWIWADGGTGDCTGLAVYLVNYVKFYYNNILITNSLANGSAYYHYATYSNTYVNLINNSLVNKGGGYIYNVPGTNTGDIDTVDYNNTYVSGSKFANWGGTDYNTLSAWKSASSKGSNSVYGDPGFTSNTDLHVSNINLNGKARPYTSVPDDIDGEIRNTSTPDIGADEFFPAANDVGISNLDSPHTFCAGTRNVRVTFQNYGIDTVKSLDIDWSVDGTSQTSYSWTGSVAPGNSSSSILLGSYAFSANTPYTFKIWTTDPNNSADQKPSNDTLTSTRFAGMSGSYSIGSSTSADYRGFNEAITAMTSRGICGPITFNVEDGTYNEQITLVQLPGMGSSNPVTFESQSGDSSLVIVTLPSTTATGNNNAAVQLRGADYTTFRGITFERTGSNTFAQVVHILNGSHNNTFSNCQMIATRVSTANANGVNIWSNLDRDTGNVFRNNRIRFGTHNILYSGTTTDHETGTIIEGNFFDSAYSSAVHIQFNDGVIVRGNTFRNVSVPGTGNFDLHLQDCDSAIRVMGNYFYDANSELGLLISMNDASSANPGITANNFIVKNSGTGIRLDGVNEHKVVFNSIYFSGTANNNAGIATTSSSSSDITLSNNNIVMEGGYVFNISSASQVGPSDHNNIFAKGSQYAVWGNIYNSLFTLKNGTSKNASSMAVDPLFISGTDLHVRNSALKEAGVPIAGVTTDIDGNLRNTTNPDIGADEFELVADDAGITAILDPGNGICEGNWPVRVVIKNFGGDPLTSATINWRVAGINQTPYNWTGNLPTDSTDTAVIGNYNFAGNTTPLISVKSTSPNGETDGITMNDSTFTGRFINPKPAVALGADSSICLGDSTTLGPPAASGFEYQWKDLAGTVLDSVAEYTVAPTSNITLVLEVTRTTTGCYNSDTISLTVNSRPVAVAGSDRTICPGASVQIGSSFQPGFGFSWTSQPPGFVSTASGPIVSPSQTTTYILKKTISSTGCFDIDSAVVTISPLPTPQIQGDTAICEGNSITYSTAANTGHSYDWQVAGGQIISGQNTETIMVEWTGTGSGSITVIETNADNCTDSTSRSVTISPNPEAGMEISGNCVNRPVSFSDTSANVISSLWRFGDGQTGTQINDSHTYTSTGSYIVKLIVSNSFGCFDSTEQTLDIIDPPTADFTTTGALCEGESVAFSNLSTDGNSYMWDFGSGQTSSQENPSFTFTTAGTYDVKLFVTGTGCDDSVIKQITIHPLPDAGFSTSVSGRDVSFVPNNTTAATYLWDFGNGEISGDMSPTHSFDIDLGWRIISLTVTGAEGCSATFTDSVYIDWVGIEESLPASLVSLSVTPNPFRAHSRIALELAKTTHLEISLFDLQGRKISTLLSGNFSAGKVHTDVKSDELKLNEGVYIVRIMLDGRTVTRQLVKAGN